MVAAPLILRELGTLARRPKVRRGRFWMSAVTLAVVAVLMQLGGSGALFVSSGKALFDSLAHVVFWYCLLLGAVATSDTLSSEKREGTLGLLFLTDLRGGDVVVGKLAAATLAAGFGVVGLIPILAVLLPMGGMNLADLARTVLVWFTALGLSASAGMLASSLGRQERTSLFAAIVGVFSVTVLLHEIAGTLETHVRPANSEEDAGAFLVGLRTVFLAVDAFSLPRLLESTRMIMSGLQKQSFAIGIALHWLLAWILLSLAARHAVRESLDLPLAAWRLRAKTWVHTWIYGTGTQRRKRRAGLLDRNPVLWLCARHHRKRGYAWLFVGSMAAVVGSLELSLHGYPWPGFMMFVFLAMIHMVFKVWIAGDVAQRMIEDRRGGALELILTTPVDPASMASGHFKSIRHQLGTPILVLLVAEWIWISQMAGRETAWRGAELLVTILWIQSLRMAADVWSIPWNALWQALHRSGTTAAVQRTLLCVHGLPGLILAAGIAWGFGAGTMLTFRNDRPIIRLWWYWTAVALAISVGSGVVARRRFLADARRVAAEGDPRFTGSGALPQAQTAPATVRPAPSNPGADVVHRPRPRRRWTLIILAGATATALGALATHRVFQERRLEDALRRIDARGEPRPPRWPGPVAGQVPAASNAIARLGPLFQAQNRAARTNRTGLRLPRGMTFNPWWSRGEWIGADRARVEEWLSPREDWFRRFRAALESPSVAYERDPERPGSSGLPASGVGDDIGLLFQAHVAIACAEGETSRAVGAILDLLRFCEILGDHPWSGGQMSRFRLVGRAIDSLELLLGSGSIEPRQAANLARALKASVDDRFGRQFLEWGQYRNANLARSPDIVRRQLSRFTTSGIDIGLNSAVLRWHEFSGQFQGDAADSLEHSMRLIDVRQLPPARRIPALRDLSNHTPRPAHGLFLTSNLLRSWQCLDELQFVHEEGIALARVRAALTALAIDRDRQRTGVLTTDLSTIAHLDDATDFLDPFSGRPFRVRITDGFLLVESEGLNRVFRPNRPRPATSPAARKIDVVVRLRPE